MSLLALARRLAVVRRAAVAKALVAVAVAALVAWNVLVWRHEVRLAEAMRLVNCTPTDASLRRDADYWRGYFADHEVASRYGRSCLHNAPPHATRGVTPLARLAFSIMAHSNAGQLEVLLRTLFAPHHAFCVHIDPNASSAVREAISAMLGCFRRAHPTTTLLLVPDPQPIYWGHVSLLRAELRCLRMLLDADAGWQYYVNLAGSELPRFNLTETERRIAALDGRSFVSAWRMPASDMERLRYKFKLEYKPILLGTSYDIIPRMTEEPLPAPPFNLTILKGWKNVVLNRTLSSWVLESPLATRLLDWARDMLIPDESFYPTLFHTHVKGDHIWQDSVPSTSHLSSREEKVQEATSSEQSAFCVRHSVWERFSSVPCHGAFRRDICNFGLLDLPRLAGDDMHCLFLNKFDVALDAAAVRCWHQLVAPTPYSSQNADLGKESPSREVTTWQRATTRQ